MIDHSETGERIRNDIERLCLTDALSDAID